MSNYMLAGYIKLRFITYNLTYKKNFGKHFLFGLSHLRIKDKLIIDNQSFVINLILKTLYKIEIKLNTLKFYFISL
jgi:hypothetical protein